MIAVTSRVSSDGCHVMWKSLYNNFVVIVCLGLVVLAAYFSLD